MAPKVFSRRASELRPIKLSLQLLHRRKQLRELARRQQLAGVVHRDPGLIGSVANSEVAPLASRLLRRQQRGFIVARNTLGKNMELGVKVALFPCWSQTSGMSAARRFAPAGREKGSGVVADVW